MAPFLKFLNRWERHISVITMIGGFSFDLIIAKRPDAIFVNVLLLIYLVASAGSIIFLNRPSRRGQLTGTEFLATTLTMKFAFGGLASNLLILYGKSGTPAGSILFLALLAGMLIGNEFLKSRYDQLRFNLVVWYVLVLTYCVIIVPTWLVHDVGARAFLLSGAASLAALLLFLSVLHTTTRLFAGQEGRRALWQVLGSTAGVALLFNVLYFTRLIPPVPLALKDSGIYHAIVRQNDGTYRARYEPAPRWQFLQDTSEMYTVSQGESAYCFASVFAPTGLVTPVAHRWERYDEASRAWQTVATVSFTLSGGRAEGYRSFSVKAGMEAGKWRCNIETAHGQLIGRVSFSVVESTTTPPLQETIL